MSPYENWSLHATAALFADKTYTAVAEAAESPNDEIVIATDALRKLLREREQAAYAACKLLRERSPLGL